MTEDVTINELVTLLTKYFKPETYQKDAKLQNLMAKQQFVTVDDILVFPLVKNYERKHLLEALKRCPNLSLDPSERFVVPKVRGERTTLILRDLPKDATIDEVKKMFDNPNCSKVKEIHPDLNETWFVTFSTEEDCTKTAQWVLKEAKFRGKSVQCRIKSEHKMKTFYNHSPTKRIPLDKQKKNSSNPSINYQKRSPEYSRSRHGRMNTYPAYEPIRDPAIAYYGPPANSSPNRRYPRSPPAASYFNAPQYNQRRNKKPPHLPPQPHGSQFDEQVDYDGIFKLINRSTFKFVIDRCIARYPNGPPLPAELQTHQDLLAKKPMTTFEENPFGKS